MRNNGLPEVRPEVFVTPDGDHVRIAVDKPAWCTTHDCVVRIDDNKVFWIEESKLLVKSRWDEQQKQKEEENDSEEIDQG